MVDQNSLSMHIYRVKNQVATAPAMTMCWQAITNCVNHSMAKMLYQRVTFITPFFTYSAFVVFSMVRNPALSIITEKYSHVDMIITKNTSVYWEEKFKYCRLDAWWGGKFEIATILTKIGSNKSNGILDTTFPASLNNRMTNWMRLRSTKIINDTPNVTIVAMIANTSSVVVRRFPISDWWSAAVSRK